MHVWIGSYIPFFEKFLLLGHEGAFLYLKSIVVPKFMYHDKCYVESNIVASYLELQNQ